MQNRVSAVSFGQGDIIIDCLSPFYYFYTYRKPKMGKIPFLFSKLSISAIQKMITCSRFYVF